MKVDFPVTKSGKVVHKKRHKVAFTVLFWGMMGNIMSSTAVIQMRTMWITGLWVAILFIQIAAFMWQAD